MATYVIAGVTGRVGSSVARELLDSGQRVTVIVRDESRAVDWARRGAALVRGSLDHPSTVGAALRDAAGFFTLLPENVAPDDFHGTRRRMADALATAIAESGVPHVVMLSALAAVLPEGNGPAKDLHYCERLLAASARRLTVLRACYFQDNVASVLPAALHAGIYPNFLATADAPIPMIATGDAGRFAARALMNPPLQHEIVDLLGPLYSARQVAEKLGVGLEKSLSVMDIPPARHREVFEQAGVPRPIAEAVAEMFGAFNAGLITPQGDRQLVGTTKIEDVIARCVRTGVTAAAQ